VRRHGRLRTVVFAVGSALLLLGGIGFYVLALREHLVPATALMKLALVVQLGFLIVLLARHLGLLWFAFLGNLDASHDEPEAYLPFVSIIAPAYNEEKAIDEALASLVELDYPNYEVIVVDDGSQDTTYSRALAWSRRPGKVPVRAFTKENGGKASALNYGIQRAAGQFVLCIDTDSALDPEVLRVTARHVRDATVGAVAGNVKVVNRRNLLTWLQALEYVEGLNMLRRAQAFFHLVNIVPGPLGLFRRRAVLDAGGYQPGTSADLTLMLLQNGWKVRYEPRAISWTEAPEQLIPLLRQRYRWTRGMLQAMRKRAHLVYARGVDFQTRLTLAYIIFEGVLWPAANITANVFLLGFAFTVGFNRILILWWLQLILLDLVSALFCVALEDEDPCLLLVAPFYRMIYVFLMDVCKFLATIEDVLGLQMTWGKLERVGTPR
jgi:poly-beta-1,6-N-acetyl-D-glucosamine synthase